MTCTTWMNQTEHMLGLHMAKVWYGASIFSFSLSMLRASYWLGLDA